MYIFFGNMIDILKRYAINFTYFSGYNFVSNSSNVVTLRGHFEDAVYFWRHHWRVPYLQGEIIGLRILYR